MIVVYLTVFISNLVNISAGKLDKVLDDQVFDCSLFNLVIIADSELHKVHDYSVRLFSFQSCHTFR